MDNDEERFPTPLLLAWKLEAESEAFNQIGKPSPQSTAAIGRGSIFTELRWESNPRFGFSFLYPAHWDRQDPSNGDGNTYRHPRDSRIEIRAWGGYAVTSTDLFDWVEQTLQWLSSESGFILLGNVQSGRHLVDFTETADGIVESRQQIEGRRVVYSIETDGTHFTAMQTFVQHGDTQVGVLCRAPTPSYGNYEELFLEISHSVHLLGANSAPFARTGSQPISGHQRKEALPFNRHDLGELGGLVLDGYNIYQGLALNSYSNGIDGWIVILIDERLSGLSGKISKMSNSEVEMPRFELDPKVWSLQQNEVKQAVLLVVDEHLRTLYFEQLGRESARLDRVYLYQNRSKPTFVLTRDYSIGMGSYNGPISSFLEVTANGIHYILPHGLMTSLKTAWAVIRTDATAEIASKSCRPDFNAGAPSEMGFEVIYERFHFANGVWTAESCRERGFWECEGPLDPGEFQGRFSRNN